MFLITAGTQHSADSLVLQKEIGHFRNDFRVPDCGEMSGDDITVNKCIVQGISELLKVVMRQISVNDFR